MNGKGKIYNTNSKCIHKREGSDQQEFFIAQSLLPKSQVSIYV